MRTSCVSTEPKMLEVSRRSFTVHAFRWQIAVFSALFALQLGTSGTRERGKARQGKAMLERMVASLTGNDSPSTDDRKR